jgi:FkbM family methyltransferase
MKKRLLSAFIPRLFSRLPPGQPLIFRFCRDYVDAFNNENNSNIHTNGELTLMHKYLPDSKMVFDVGANIGLWSELALEINPAINLHCFEPSHSTYKTLIDNLKAWENVICNNFGLSSSRQQAELLVFEKESGMNSLYSREGLEDGWGIQPQSIKENIELRTLDDYCDEKEIRQIDFLKVDIEGNELEFFRGAKNLLSKNLIRLIQFEYGGTYIDSKIFLKDIFKFFSNYPTYRFYKIFPASLKLFEHYDQREENFQYQNWVVTNAIL